MFLQRKKLGQADMLIYFNRLRSLKARLQSPNFSDRFRMLFPFIFVSSSTLFHKD